MDDMLQELEQRFGWPQFNLSIDCFEKIVTLIELCSYILLEEFFNSGKSFKGCKQNSSDTKEAILLTTFREDEKRNVAIELK